MQQFTKQQIISIRRWLLCIAIVKFDINQGQLIEKHLPNDSLTKKEEKQIAMLSFPDSNSFCGNEGSLTYIFTLNRINNKQIYGYTCFKQNKDKNMFRGYFQKSLVILSQVPLLHFYEELCELLVFKTFSNQQTVFLELKKFLKQVANWPDPQSKTTPILSVMEYKFKVQIPDYKCEKQKQLGQKILEKQNSMKFLSIENQYDVGIYEDISILESYKDYVKILWNIWEIVLLNKALLIISQNPRLVSHAILSAVSLINPLEYAVNFKPYLTVYDPQIQQIQHKLQNKKQVRIIVGGTNPVFLKIMKKFQNIINLDDSYQRNIKNIKTLTQADQSFQKILLNNENEQKMKINQLLIRKNFRKLTQQFVSKFQIYFLLQKNDLKRFEKNQFLKFLKKQTFSFGSCLNSKSNIIKLYEQFIQTPNFTNYLIKRNIIRIT